MGIRAVTIVAVLQCATFVFLFLPSHNKAHENFNAEQKWFADIKQELITDAILAAWEKIFGLLDFKDQDKVIETK